jgi:hypothetical protein
LNDPVFDNGMLSDAQNLGDDISQWIPEFKKDIDGVLLVAGHSYHGVLSHLHEILDILQVKEVYHITGKVRPGKEAGHEQYVSLLLNELLLTTISFGFEDGISNPAVDGVDKDLSGQGTVDQG